MSQSLTSDLTPAIRRAQLSLFVPAYIRWLTKYRPDQARVPAGSREGGQWTDEGGGGDSGSDGGGGTEAGTLDAQEAIGSVNLSTDDVVAYPHPDGTDGTYDIEFVSSRTSVTIDYSRALTGISTIDDTTKRLSETLGDTMARVDIVPEWAPSVYGTAVHVDFGAQVKSQGLRGVEVEQSFFDEVPRGYGYPGSVRTDVLLRNDSGDIIAIYDVKTGGAVLSSSRVRELREKTGVGIGVPIIELQVNRGVTIKGQVIRKRNIGRVIALLWNPVHRGNADRAAGA